MITLADWRALVALQGAVAQEDIEWAEALHEPQDADEFASETIFVICNSGMRYTVARGIFDRVMPALAGGSPVIEVFRHPGKAAAIETIWRDRTDLYAECIHRAGKGPFELLAFCEALPWIGGITKYHLAKNFGTDVAKPDVHLQRLADREGCTAQALCERLAKETGLRVATVDTVLWRACADGVLDSRTGTIRRTPS